MLKETTTTIKLIIFDLDGTLLNTLDDLADAANYVLSNHGFPTHPVDAYRYFVGNGMPTLITRILPEGQKEGAIYETCFKEFLEYYTLHMHDKTTIYEGLIDTLEALQSRGIQLAVATNKVQTALAPLMAEYFPTIRWAALFGQRPGVPTKPDPQIVYDILDQTGFQKQETLYLGDTNVDMQTAHGAGLTAVGVLWGYRPRPELEEANAEFIIKHPSEILTLLR